ncbi:hypothetical protein BMF94_3890 [Rhodotorula taiwanensis]|uniref:Ketoreductase domain-containing protein n=1 Tax=Rhodotorula taiwanensis TaxID=741276 RepID=A0A2S5B8E8_9BASI|nr:hypothetical protein BMF94_3890 [Rhodotorula taiwanensis]
MAKGQGNRSLSPLYLHTDTLTASQFISNMATSLPQGAPHLVSTKRHDLYDAISPTSALKNAADGLSVLVTGSGRGVGRAEALAFAQAGAKKVVLTSRSRTELDETKELIDKETAGGDCEVIVCEADLCDPDSVEKLFEAAGPVDVLVNNAGYLEPCVPIRDSNPSDWKRTLDVNHYGTYLPTRAFLRAAHARSQGNASELAGKLTVINTSSTGSMGTRPGFSCYQPQVALQNRLDWHARGSDQVLTVACTTRSKSFINRFTEFIHFEEPDVRTFAMHPGGVMTKLARDSMPLDTHSFLTDTPELAAGFAVWLATSKESDFLRGRYVSATWDVTELLGKRDEILEKDLLWTRVVGQEQASLQRAHIRAPTECLCESGR